MSRDQITKEHQRYLLDDQLVCSVLLYSDKKYKYILFKNDQFWSLTENLCGFTDLENYTVGRIVREDNDVTYEIMSEESISSK